MEGNRSQETERLQSPSTRSDERAWQELQGFVAHIDRLARTSTAVANFYQTLLNELTMTVAAIAGAVWLVESDQTLRLGPTCGIPLAGDDDWSFDAELHRHLATVVAQQGKLHYLPPESEASSSDVCNDGPHGVFVVPIVVDQRTTAVVELIQRGGMSAAARRGHERLLATLAEIAADFHQRLEIDRLRSFRGDAAELLQLIANTQGQATLKGVGDQLVAGAAKLLGCDRVSLHVQRGRQLELLAISGADRFDPRSNALRTLQRLAHTFGKQGHAEPYQYSIASQPANSADGLGEAFTRARDEHLEITGATQIAIIPLETTVAERSYRDGLLVCESFSADRPLQLEREFVAAVIQHTTLALHQALTTDRLPLGRWQRKLAERQWFFTLRGAIKSLLLVTMVTALIVGVVYFQTEFYVHAQGELRAANTREIFAPADGEVAELHVQDGVEVAENELLIQLQSPALDLQLQQVVGEYETARKRLEGVESARVRLAPTESNAATRLSQLSAEEQELMELLQSKQRELDLLRAQRESLALRSPLGGRVMTWDAARRLQNRPVRRGQALLAVADTHGDWLVHLFIRQDRLAYLQAAQIAQSEPLVVRFSLATAPDRLHQAEIIEISSQVEWSEELHTHGVLAKVRLAEPASHEVRPGSVVYGRIGCGRMSLGYVWLHDAIERIRAEWRLATFEDSGNLPK